jgi:hypothetical protein
MLSKRAGSSLILLPVLVFAQLHPSSSNSHGSQGASQPQVGLQRALPLAYFGPFGPGGQLRRPPFSPWDKTTRKRFGHPRIGWRNRSNPIFLTAPTFGSGGYYSESVVVRDVNRDGKPDLVVTDQCSASAGMKRCMQNKITFWNVKISF